MLKSKISPILLTALLLITYSESAKAQTQWNINGAGNLESNPPAGPHYQNVVVDNYFGINMITNPQLLLPPTTGASASTVYPLTVNGTTVLWDATSADAMRNVIGLSTKGGIDMFSGDTYKNSAGLYLYAYNSTTTPGLVRSLSYGATSPTAYAFQHTNWNPSTSTLENMFGIAHNHDTHITGNILLDFPVATDYRNIEGLSNTSGVNIYTGTSSSVGTQIQLNGPSSSTLSGLMQFTAFGPSVISSGSVGLAYDFLTGTNPSSPFAALQINNNGYTRIGNYSTPTTTDRLTVDGNLYLNAPDNVDVTGRNILARSTGGSINVTAGAATDGSDGACLTAYASTAATNAGAFTVKSNGSSPNALLGYAYMNNTSGTNHNIFLISKQGLGCIGYDMTLGSIVNSDVLTVKSALGFYSVNDADERDIHGETNTGSLAIGSYTGNTSGSSIYLYGRTNASKPGQVVLSSYGTSGGSTYFKNYDGSAFHNNVSISNTGQTVIGKDLDVTTAVAGDVLTVRDQMGFYSPTGQYVNINGNSTNKALALHANTGSQNGGTLEMYGPSAIPYTGAWDGDRRGQMRYISSSAGGVPANNYGHNFYTWDGTNYNTNMAITNGGKVIIGTDLIQAQNYMTTSNNYDLYVENGILTEMVRVAVRTTPDWADYVFAKDYKLMPLHKVEEYVKKNKHLPDVPSADEVTKEGIDVAGMDSKLLQKVEELTLYVIQQQKEIEELQKKLEEK